MGERFVGGLNGVVDVGRYIVLVGGIVESVLR